MVKNLLDPDLSSSVLVLYFQTLPSATEAILLCVIFQIATTLTEVPCGIILNRWGRRVTFIAMGSAEVSACILFATGSDFFSFALGNVMYSASAAFASGTDSALLYEFLTATDCWGETAHHELKSWLVSCTALALSAGLGGVMVRQSDTLAYFATATAFAAGLLVAMGFHEPPAADCGDQRQRVQSYRYAIKAALEHPVLNWLLAQSIVMSAACHLPFVFGQPFFLAALKTVGFETRVRL